MINIQRDEYFMRQAINLAYKGLYTSHPNPRVGCVIVNDDHIVGKGFHRQAGKPHAEIYALQMAKQKAQGATCYVTLEPCCHHGKTGPCVEALRYAKIKRVVIAMKDPNSLVNGQGITYLRSIGIDITVGTLAHEAQSLNRSFCHRIQTGRPYVRAKVGASLDGAIAMASGESQWITSLEAREDVQLWRARSGAILTGIETVLRDDPKFTVRKESLIFKQPLRVICDSCLRTPKQAKILSESGNSVIMITERVSEAQKNNWYSNNIGGENSILYVSSANLEGRVDLLSCLTYLAEQEINSVLVEAGPTLLGSLIQLQLVDELMCYFAPKMLGDGAKSMVKLPYIKNLAEHVPLVFFETKQIGPDVRVRANFNWGTKNGNS